MERSSTRIDLVIKGLDSTHKILCSNLTASIETWQ